jgi:protease I
MRHRSQARPFRILAPIFAVTLLMGPAYPSPDIYPAPLLAGKRIAILADDHFQIEEALYAFFRLRESGAEVKVVSHHSPAAVRDAYSLPTDMDLSRAAAVEWDGVYVLGGFSPLEMREDPKALELVQRCAKRGGLVAAICHGVVLLVPTGLLRGRNVTGSEARVVEMQNAGALYHPTAPQIDGNLITAISPGDNGPMLDGMIHWFKGGEAEAKANLMNQYLKGKKVAVVLDNRFSLNQYVYPLKRLFHNGADVKVVAAQKTTLNERNQGAACVPDLTAAEAMAADFDAVILTGDWAADAYRRNPGVLDFIVAQLKRGKLVASINEGHTALISARACGGYSFAVTWGSQADIADAGGTPVLRPVVRDRNLITCARETDMGEMMRELVTALVEKK